MKILFLLHLVAMVAISSAEVDVLSGEFIDSINDQQSSWVAGKNFPEGTTLESLRKLTGLIGLHPDPSYKPKLHVHKVNRASIPQTFDARTQWPQCESIRRIRDQGSCGSCWAFAATETMSDRLCIHSGGAQKFTFSPEDVVGCCSYCGDCSYGYMMPAFDFWINEGIVSGGDLNSNEGCKPYTTGTHVQGVTPSCVRSCRSGYSKSYSADKHYGSRDYIISSSIEQIQQEILTNGPLIVNFEVFADFYNYKSGVYRHVTGDSAGWHVVKIIGWGVEKGTPYWLIANSWGGSWGESGFFKMLRGQNEVGIENNPYAATPAL